MLKEDVLVTSREQANNKVTVELAEKYRAELFGVLCALTSGEANVIVRSVVGKGFLYDGFVALQFLNVRFNPKTPARLLQCLSAVISPGVIKDVRNLAKAVEEWETKTNKLKCEFDEQLSESLRVAVLLSMLPRDFQDMVFQMGSVSGTKLEYHVIRDKVLSVAGHRVQMSQPTPMDTGALDWWGRESGEGGESEEGCGACGEEGAVMALGKGGQGGSQCHRCGGFGHFGRECGTPVEKVDLG